jgi:hypothetical protein
MSTLSQAIYAAEKAREKIRAAIEAGHSDWTIASAARHEAEGQAAADLRRAGWTVREASGGVLVRAVGRQSTSTMGLLGALENWLAAARKAAA